MSKIRLDIELDTAEALFELISEVIKSKRVHVRKIPLNKIALAMLGVTLADKIHSIQVVRRIEGNKKPPEKTLCTKLKHDLLVNDPRNKGLMGSTPCPDCNQIINWQFQKCQVCNQVDCICGKVSQ